MPLSVGTGAVEFGYLVVVGQSGIVAAREVRLADQGLHCVVVMLEPREVVECCAIGY